MTWRPFSFDVINLATLDDKMGGDSDLVYSTSPQRAVGEDDESYVVKGPELEVVFAELAGCVLASAVGITVPAVRSCRISSYTLAGSREVVPNLRVIEPFLRSPKRVVNFAEVFEAIVVDIWLGNVDRNMGNVIGHPMEQGKIEFVFIDFEKSTTLRPNPTINSAIIDPRQLWPSDQLRDRLANHKPLHPPGETMNRVSRIDAATCLSLIQPVAESLGGVPWVESTVDVLSSRANRIRPLAEAVWK